MQAARNGHGAAQGNVQVGEFLCGGFGSGVHGRAGFGDYHAGNLEIREAFHHVAHQLLAFARGGAVADGDQVHLVARDERGQGVDRALAVAARLERVDGGGVHDLAGHVDDSDLAAGADAGIQAQHGLGAGRRGQQQVFQVGGEHADGFGFAAFAQAADQFAFKRRQQLDAPGPAADFAQPARAR
ncbi:hypothetical protein FQZ97_714290 [compost metagenome]